MRLKFRIFYEKFLLSFEQFLLFLLAEVRRFFWIRLGSPTELGWSELEKFISFRHLFWLFLRISSNSRFNTSFDINWYFQHMIRHPHRSYRYSSHAAIFDSSAIFLLFRQRDKISLINITTYSEFQILFHTYGKRLNELSKIWLKLLKFF